MKGGTQAAVALGVGYLLGRRRKMRMTTILAAGAMTGGLGALGGGLLRRGAKMLGSTEALGTMAPQLGELADTVRGDLLDAGKAAATAAVSNRLESLTDSLHERAELVRDPGAAAAGAAASAGKAARTGAGEATRRVRRRGRPAARDEEADELRDEDDLSDEDDLRDEEEFSSEKPDEPLGEEREAGESKPAPRRRRTSTTTRRRSPVVRAGR
jgi:hypothetical protein